MRTVGDELRRHARNALSHRGDRPLRQGLRPAGRRPRLLPGAGEVEARDRARAGLPTRGRQREAAGLRARHRRPDAVGRRPRRVQRLRGDLAPRSARSTGRPKSSGSRSGRRRALEAGQVRVRVGAAAVNYPDVLLVANHYQISVPPPFVVGSEFAGVVVEVADGDRRSRRRRPGDRHRNVRRLRRRGGGGRAGAGPDPGRGRRPHGGGVRGGPPNGVSHAALGGACAVRATP